MRAFIKPLFFFILSISNVFSQETHGEVFTDSLITNNKSEYIKDYTNQLNVKLEFSNDIQTFDVPFKDELVKVEPNLGHRYALIFSYKFLSIRVGVRQKVSDESIENNGDSESFRIKFQLLFDNWSHNFDFNRVKGYYIDDSNFFNKTLQATNNIIFPELTTNTFSGTTSYKFNKNYSIRSTVSQTEIQIKSAGSIIPSIDYNIYNIDGLESYIDNQGNTILRTDYIKTTIYEGVLNFGYHYTFVYKKWFANAFFTPGLGFNYSDNTVYHDAGNFNDNYSNIISSLKIGVGIGYNAEKIFFGGSLNNISTRELQEHNDIKLNSSKNAFFIYFGYRFKAPKQISKPIDSIEEKIPMLQH